MHKVHVAPTVRSDQMTLQADMDTWNEVYKSLVKANKPSVARSIARSLAHDATGPDTAKRITLPTSIATTILEVSGVSF